MAYPKNRIASAAGGVVGKFDMNTSYVAVRGDGGCLDTYAVGPSRVLGRTYFTREECFSTKKAAEDYLRREEEKHSHLGSGDLFFVVDDVPVQVYFTTGSKRLYAHGQMFFREEGRAPLETRPRAFSKKDEFMNPSETPRRWIAIRDASGCTQTHQLNERHEFFDQWFPHNLTGETREAAIDLLRAEEGRNVRVGLPAVCLFFLDGDVPVCFTFMAGSQAIFARNRIFFRDQGVATRSDLKGKSVADLKSATSSDVLWFPHVCHQTAQVVATAFHRDASERRYGNLWFKKEDGFAEELDALNEGRRQAREGLLDGQFPTRWYKNQMGYCCEASVRNGIYTDVIGKAVREADLLRHRFNPFVVPAVPTQGDPMTATEKTTLSTRATSALKEETADAGLRSIGRQFVRVAKEGAIRLLDDNVGEGAARTVVVAVLQTRLGTSIVGYGLGLAIPHIPRLAENPIAVKVGRELRVEAESLVFDTIADYIVPGCLAAIAAVSATMPLPTSDPLNK